MNLRKIVFVFFILIAIFSLASCSKKGDNSKMDDEKFVQYVIEYLKIENEMGQKADNPKALEMYNKKMKKLEEKYPGAADYPSTLTQEQQDALGKKVDEALSKLNLE